MRMKRYDLLKDGLFEILNVPAPAKLETTEDYSELTQHLVSVFRPALNLCYRQHGYEARLQQLTMLVLLVSGILPASFPRIVRDYPASLGDICAMAGNCFVTGSLEEEKAG